MLTTTIFTCFNVDWYIETFQPQNETSSIGQGNNVDKLLFKAKYSLTASEVPGETECNVSVYIVRHCLTVVA